MHFTPDLGMRLVNALHLRNSFSETRVIDSIRNLLSLRVLPCRITKLAEIWFDGAYGNTGEGKLRSIGENVAFLGTAAAWNCVGRVRRLGRILIACK